LAFSESLAARTRDVSGLVLWALLSLGGIFMTRMEAKCVAAWRDAAKDLGFQFSSPYTATAFSGERFEALALVHEYGGSIGTLISVGGEPSAEANYPRGDGYSESCLGRGCYTRYDRATWIEMLCDWVFLWRSSIRP
jgi:hypothetical protein